MHISESNVDSNHRCNLDEIGSVLNSKSVGDGGTAAVVIRDGVNLGLLYIE